MLRILVVLALATSGPIARADAGPPPRVTFAEALGVGDQLSTVAGWATAADALSRAPVPSGWPALVVSIGIGPRIAPRGDRGLEGGIAVQQSVPLANPGEARNDTRDAMVARANAVRLELALDARLVIASAWIESWAAGERLANAERDLALAGALAEVMGRGRELGAVTAPELADARAFEAEAEARRIDAEGAVADTSFALAAALERSGRVVATGELPNPEVSAPGTWDELLVRARHLPAVTARRLAARAARIRAVEERETTGPHLLLGAEMRRDSPGAAVAIATVGVTLPHDRGQREAAFAEAEARVQDSEAAGLAARGALDLERALHEVEHTREMLDVLVTTLVPAAELAASSRSRAFEVGETTIVELLTARRTALAASTRVGEARAAHAWARVRAWLLLQATQEAR